ncbi:MAG TPA: transcription elongation factor GreA [Anaerolineales bacterium]|nr:transcription elongation factor GreA [Anaerolineales bacterium]
MNEQLYLTEEEAKNLREELAELTGPRRAELAIRLKEAKAMGDLSENADWHKAKEDQGFLEGRIQEVEYILNKSLVITDREAKSRLDTVHVGNTVQIVITMDGVVDDPEEYKIVGVEGANVAERKISNESPLGRALMGHRVGQVVTVQSQNGEYTAKILKIT